MSGYRVILADPPWQYANYTSAVHGAAASAYETMPNEDIAAIPVSKWAHEDGCILAMWATWPKLADAMAVMAAWGFEFVTGWPWIKTLPERGEIRRGIGFWAQSTSEPMLIGRRGGGARPSYSEPLMGLLTGEPRVFYAPRWEHSRKPLEIHEWLEGANGPHLELFARREREGWTCWGLDLGWRLGPHGVDREPLPALGGLFAGADMEASA